MGMIGLAKVSNADWQVARNVHPIGSSYVARLNGLGSFASQLPTVTSPATVSCRNSAQGFANSSEVRHF